MDLNDVYNFNVHTLQVYHNQNETWDDLSILRKTIPDFRFCPIDGTSIELNTGDLFLSAVNVYNNFKHYSKYLTELYSLRSAGYDYLRQIVEGRKIISSNMRYKGLKTLDNNILIKANKEIRKYNEQIDFYNIFLKYVMGYYNGFDETDETDETEKFDDIIMLI